MSLPYPYLLYFYHKLSSIIAETLTTKGIATVVLILHGGSADQGKTALLRSKDLMVWDRWLT